MQNKAKVKIGKMCISIATKKDYDKNNEQSTTSVIKTKPNKANFKIPQIQSKERILA